MAKRVYEKIEKNRKFKCLYITVKVKKRGGGMDNGKKKYVRERRSRKGGGKKSGAPHESYKDKITRLELALAELSKENTRLSVQVSMDQEKHKMLKLYAESMCAYHGGVVRTNKRLNDEMKNLKQEFKNVINLQEKTGQEKTLLQAEIVRVRGMYGEILAKIDESTIYYQNLLGERLCEIHRLRYELGLSKVLTEPLKKDTMPRGLLRISPVDASSMGLLGCENGDQSVYTEYPRNTNIPCVSPVDASVGGRTNNSLSPLLGIFSSNNSSEVDPYDESGKTVLYDESRKTVSYEEFWKSNGSNLEFVPYHT